MPILRAMFDTNIYVSFLLSAGGPSSVINDLFARVFAVDIELVLPIMVLDELMEQIENKPALASRIAMEDVRRLEVLLRAVATITPKRALEMQSVVRDPDDDYIVAYALETNTDYLVSGDRDLLILGDTLNPLSILSPREFLAMIDRANSLDP